MALDLDGTLLRSDGTLSDLSVATLRSLASRRHRIVYVTARHLEAARLVTDQVGVPADVASSLGAALHELPGGEPVRDRPLPAETARAVAERLAHAAPGTSFGWVEQGRAYVQPAYPDPFGTAHIAESPGCLPVNPVAKLFAKNITAEPGAFWEAAVEAAAAAGATSLPASAGLAEFVLPGVDKGAVLRAWCSLRGIDERSVVAFGDSLPDLPLLAAAGLGLAVGNSTERVRAAADAVVGGNDDDGVALALHDLFQLSTEEVRLHTDAPQCDGASLSK
ncbi:HAD family hydrolase [Streptomyces sp. NPDC056255]|uniref:HAD family hydrolase n=1 Tax=Streptomyces sp. NPDC056255 TaxID=3345764 RepID=UPI0035E1B73A